MVVLYVYCVCSIYGVHWNEITFKESQNVARVTHNSLGVVRISASIAAI